MTNGYDTSPDASFSRFLEFSRERIARNVSCSSPHRNTREISSAVHGLILRMVVLAFLEARGFLSPKTLSGCTEKGNPRENLKELFIRIETEFGLLPVSCIPESGSETYGALPALWDLDEKTITGILTGIPSVISFLEDDNAIFDRLPVLYDRFLQRDIFRRGGALVSIEDKPALPGTGSKIHVPKALVGYLTDVCVGKVIAGRNPADLADYRILDPACGSGRFLLAAYRTLVRFYASWYRERLIPVLESGRPPSGEESGQLLPPGTPGIQFPVERRPDGVWVLAQSECIRILRTHIFGLDADPRSVESARVFLSLQTLVPESGSRETSDNSGTPARDQILNGCFLLGPDLFRIPDMMFVPEQIRAGIRTFDCGSGFSGPACEGGFSGIISNLTGFRVPLRTGLQEYLQTHYAVYHGEDDAVPYAVERVISLLRNGGLCGLILTDRWLRAGYTAAMRDLLGTIHIEEIGRVPGRDDKGPAEMPGFLTLTKKPPGHAFRVLDIRSAFSGSVSEPLVFPAYEIETGSLGSRGWTLEDPRQEQILAAMRRIGRPLPESIRGTILHGISSQRREDPASPGLLIRYGRYGNDPALRKPHPLRSRHPRISLHQPVTPSRKILLYPSFPRIACTFDTSESRVPAPFVILPSKSPLFLAILNSRLFSFALAVTHENQEEKPGMYSWEEIARMPVLTLDMEDPHSRNQYEKLAYYTGRMLEFTGSPEVSGNSDGIKNREREREMTDREIDRIVYDLFGISEGGRKYVEEYGNRYNPDRSPKSSG
ncbi:MAG: hypothetical protein ABFC24_07905 [Methanoregulaceae archaeon]